MLLRVPENIRVTMTIANRNVICYHLEVIHGITVKSCPRKRRTFPGGTKTFHVPLENVPRSHIPEVGLVPCFLVEACTFLLGRLCTVGLFRKPGSHLRMKSLREKLNRGEGCLSAAVPYDVASLVKQFCRELPEPLLPSDFHEALLKAQALPVQQERTSALQLLSCLLPARNASVLSYLFSFLSKVSKSCAENLMTSSNLAIVFAPCLFPSPKRAEMSEGQLQLRVGVLCNFIDNPHIFGVIPKVVMDSMDFLFRSQHVQEPHSKKKRYSLIVPSNKPAPSPRPRERSCSVSDLSPPSASSVSRQPLRRFLGLEAFPGVHVFRTYSPRGDPRGLSSNKTLKDTLSPVSKEAWRRLKSGELFGVGSISKFARGQVTCSSPLLSSVGCGNTSAKP